MAFYKTKGCYLHVTKALRLDIAYLGALSESGLKNIFKVLPTRRKR